MLMNYAEKDSTGSPERRRRHQAPLTPIARPVRNRIAEVRPISPRQLGYSRRMRSTHTPRQWVFAKEEYGPAIADYNKAIELRLRSALLPAPRTATPPGSPQQDWEEGTGDYAEAMAGAAESGAVITNAATRY